MKDIEKALSDLFKHAAAGNAAVIVFRILVGLILLGIASRIIEFLIRRLKRRLEDKQSTDPGAVSFLCAVLKILLYLVVILMILNGFGFKTSSLLTILGSLGLAIVLGLKDSLSNVAGGLIIMIFKPFKGGDHIVEKTHDCEGNVTEIGLFFTKLKTLDEKTILIPNQLITSTAIINHTLEEYRTLEMRYSVVYGTDLDKAKDLIRSTILADQMDQVEKFKEKMELKAQAAASESEESSSLIRKVLDSTLSGPDDDTGPVYDPDSVHVFVYELADSAVILCSRSRVRNQDYWTTRFRLYEDVYNSFNAAGIEFAYPHMDVHVDS